MSEGSIEPTNSPLPRGCPWINQYQLLEILKQTIAGNLSQFGRIRLEVVNQSSETQADRIHRLFVLHA